MYPITPHAHRLLIHSFFLLIRRPPCAAHRRLFVSQVEQRVEVEPRPLARKVRVVRGWDEADGLGRARIEVARSVRALL